MEAVRSDSVPNLLLMHYAGDWSVRNLLLIPSFFFSVAAVEQRKPLAASARRAGWVGCNILLSEIADEGKIKVVSQGVPTSQEDVRLQYQRVRPLARIRAEIRGWTIDILRMIRRLKCDEFSLKDVYGFECDLSTIYPDNRNVRAKIRQQLQVLRNLGFIAFLGGGHYRVIR